MFIEFEFRWKNCRWNWTHSKTTTKQTKTRTVHYDDVIMGTIASQITSLTIVYSTVYSGADQSKHKSSASLAFVWGIHRGPVNSPHKWPVTRKKCPFADVIMLHTSRESSPTTIWISLLSYPFWIKAIETLPPDIAFSIDACRVANIITWR